MKRNPTIPNSDFPRCTHTSPSGRRCRSLCSSAESPYCLRHKPKEDPAAALVRDLQEFRSVADVTVFLSRLISALSRDQISTRRAAVLSDVAISLMNALRSLQKEYETNQRVDGFEILPWTWSMPRRGSHGFDDTDDARAFFAQQYADKMRAKVEKAMAERGLTSRHYPDRFDERPNNYDDEHSPSSSEPVQQSSEPNRP
jgi:hypothetical protein